MVLTGASSGIGAATDELTHHRGAQVVMAARRSERLAQPEREVPGSLAVTPDVTRASAVARLRDRASEAFGSIDVRTNNAGQGRHLSADQDEKDDFRAVWDLNVLAPLALM
jgi:NADP-dependent 3-hydroxy acid dehydrogenase YdfG